MNTHTDTEAHNSFSGILNSEEYFPFLRKISRNFLENFRRIFPEKTTSLLVILNQDRIESSMEISESSITFIVRTSFTNIRADANAIIQTLLEIKLKRLLYTHFKVICSY